mmetsp:Transcript_21989/g.31588  ORF Transcript_21989/g.31588 Transcript_21989/m.31588 type:complete len:81 (-) Transcript_21989:526-768(-)
MRVVLFFVLTVAVITVISVLPDLDYRLQMQWNQKLTPMRGIQKIEQLHTLMLQPIVLLNLQKKELLSCLQKLFQRDSKII